MTVERPVHILRPYEEEPNSKKPNSKRDQMILVRPQGGANQFPLAPLSPQALRTEITWAL
jgi:hypothetical protein